MSQISTPIHIQGGARKRAPGVDPDPARPDLACPDFAPAVVGNLHRDGGMAVGWCWSPARPRERLRVALLVDGAVVAAAVAARLRLDLLREGVRDGYHGFALPLPSPMPAATRIEARELASGAVFGRILLDGPADVGAWHARADALSARLAELHGRLGPGLRSCDPPAALGALGSALASRPGIRPGPGLHLAPAPARVSPARVADPALSLVLDVAGSRHGAAGVGACAMLLRHHGAELVLTGDGSDPHSATLAALAGATHCLDTGGPAARANRAARCARGGVLVFLRPDGLCPSALASVLRRSAPTRDPAAQAGPATAAGAWPVLAGQPVLSAARQAGLDRPFGVPPDRGATSSRAGLTLIVSQALFVELGGLDVSLEDGANLPLLDFALRADVAGHEVLGWTEPDAMVATPWPGAAAARQRFSRRWAGQQAPDIGLPASKAGLCPDPPA